MRVTITITKVVGDMVEGPTEDGGVYSGTLEGLRMRRAVHAQ